MTGCLNYEVLAPSATITNIGWAYYDAGTVDYLDTDCKALEADVSAYDMAILMDVVVTGIPSDKCATVYYDITWKKDGVAHSVSTGIGFSNPGDRPSTQVPYMWTGTKWAAGNYTDLDVTVTSVTYGTC